MSRFRRVPRVRTAAGVARYGLPINTPIVGGEPLPHLVLSADTWESDDDFIVLRGNSGVEYQLSWWPDSTDRTEWFLQDQSQYGTDDVLAITTGKTEAEARSDAMRAAERIEVEREGNAGRGKRRKNRRVPVDPAAGSDTPSTPNSATGTIPSGSAPISANPVGHVEPRGTDAAPAHGRRGRRAHDQVTAPAAAVPPPNKPVNSPLAQVSLDATRLYGTMGDEGADDILDDFRAFVDQADTLPPSAPRQKALHEALIRVSRMSEHAEGRTFKINNTDVECGTYLDELAEQVFFQMTGKHLSDVLAEEEAEAQAEYAAALKADERRRKAKASRERRAEAKAKVEAAEAAPTGADETVPDPEPVEPPPDPTPGPDRSRAGRVRALMEGVQLDALMDEYFATARPWVSLTPPERQTEVMMIVDKMMELHPDLNRDELRRQVASGMVRRGELAHQLAPEPGAKEPPSIIRTQKHAPRRADY